MILLVKSLTQKNADCVSRRNTDKRLWSPKLARLDQLGMSISIDDFGTGYFSLGMLHLLHPSRVEIDRRFVQ